MCTDNTKTNIFLICAMPPLYYMIRGSGEKGRAGYEWGEFKLVPCMQKGGMYFFLECIFNNKKHFCITRLVKVQGKKKKGF